MALCLNNGTIYIHIYKTGGESVRTAMKQIGACREIGHKHATADEIKDETFYSSSIKFTLVRNPFDWLVSLWYFICNSKRHELNNIIPKNFNDFIDFWVENMQPGQKYQHNHQHHFINDDVCVYKLENINNILPAFLPKLKHLNANLHRPYKEYYTGETKAIVSRILKKDIQKFGYKF